MQTHADQAFSGKLTGGTRRDFIRGIAAAGASTATAVALERAGVIDLFAETAFGHGRGHNAFSDFSAIAAERGGRVRGADAASAPTCSSRGATSSAARAGARFRYGFNNDFLAYFPLKGSDEGLLFVNHEYPDPFFLHGYKPNGSAKTPAQVQEEQDNVGNSILHIKRSRDGEWKVVSPSAYNRRIYGDRPDLEFTGPLRGATGHRQQRARLARQLLRRRHAVGHRALVRGELRRLRHQRHARRRLRLRLAPVRRPARGRRVRVQHVQEVRLGLRARPVRPGLGRPQAHRARPLPAREHGVPARPGQEVRALHGRRQEQRGRLQVRLRPQLSSSTSVEQPQDPRGRARSTSRAGSPRAGAGSRRPGDVTPITRDRGHRPLGRGARRRARRHGDQLRARFGTAEYDTHFATNRPEDVEVAEDGTVFIALTNNTSAACSTRTARSAACARTATTRSRSTFTWHDYAAGGPTSAGGGGFSSPDNLVFDKAGNVWVVTDISSSRLNRRRQRVHSTTPTTRCSWSRRRGPNEGVAFRFANGPVEAELTGPVLLAGRATRCSSTSSTRAS